MQVFNFPGKYCSFFTLHSRQIAALLLPLNLVRTLLLDVWDTGAETNVWAPREPDGTSGDLQARCGANWCSLLRTRSQKGWCVATVANL